MSSANTPELTLESIYNQEWKAKLIIGSGAGIYVGSGIDAKFIIKGSDAEIAIDQLLGLYQRICSEHNARLANGHMYTAKRPGLMARYRLWRERRKPFEYNYPSDL